MNNNFNYIIFAVLVMGGGVMCKISALKDIFYVPMQEYMHLSNTQIGLLMSAYGFVHIVCSFVSIYTSSRFCKKHTSFICLMTIGLIGLYICTFPGYYPMLIAWGVMAFCSEVIYWPIILKATRHLGDSKMQGRLFGFLEAGRGAVDCVVTFIALGVFKFFGQNEFAFKMAILFYSLVIMIAGVLSYFVFSYDNYTDSYDKKSSWQGVAKALKMPKIWIVSINITAIYSAYCGITYFIPLLKQLYMLPMLAVGYYGLVNQYLLKIIAGPFAGYLVDKKIKSATKYLRYSLILSLLVLIILIILPLQSTYAHVVIFLALVFAFLTFTMRAVYFAPVDEVQIPKQISGQAMAIACAIGYSPQFFSYALYGYLIDTYPGILGYKIVFMIMACFVFVGIFTSTLLTKTINCTKTR